MWKVHSHWNKFIFNVFFNITILKRMIYALCIFNFILTRACNLRNHSFQNLYVWRYHSKGIKYSYIRSRSSKKRYKSPEICDVTIKVAHYLNYIAHITMLQLYEEWCIYRSYLYVPPRSIHRYANLGKERLEYNRGSCMLNLTTNCRLPTWHISKISFQLPIVMRMVNLLLRNCCYFHENVPHATDYQDIIDYSSKIFNIIVLNSDCHTLISFDDNIRIYGNLRGLVKIIATFYCQYFESLIGDEEPTATESYSWNKLCK
jgi:hypothetical protein